MLQIYHNVFSYANVKLKLGRFLQENPIIDKNKKKIKHGKLKFSYSETTYICITRACQTMADTKQSPFFGILGALGG